MKQYLISKDDVLQGISTKSLIGGKAAGFTFLKDYQHWIPEFVVLSAEFFSDHLLQNGNVFQISLFKKELNDLFFDSSIERLIDNSPRLIIRSSAANESIDNRGEHDSHPCTSSLSSVLELVTFIYEQWSKSSNAGEALALIIQREVPAIAKGHLSNERRVSERDRDWLIDYEIRQAKYTQENRRFKIFQNRYPDPDEFIIPDRLLASKLDDIDKQLHHPAELVTLKHKGLRVHYEWVWDGSEVWVVQADSAADNQDAIDPNIFIDELANHRDGEGISFKSLKEIKTLDTSHFNKTEHQRLFHKSGMDTTNLWFIDAEILFDKSSLEKQKLYDDLELLLSYGPIVIRTDLDDRKYSLEKRQNLPRSNSLLKLKDAKSFMQKSLDDLNISKANSSEICFLVHSYIPSLSSAFCYADPTNPKVRIDSIWGLPDGLQYYAHDSYEVNVTTKQTLREKKRFKGFMLGANLNGDGQWIPTEVNSPYDWRHSINKSSRNEIASETLKLARYLNKPVVVMWFVKTPDLSIHPTNVPWYLEEYQIVDFSIEKRDSVYSRNLFKIRNYEDIKKAKIEFKGSNHYNSILLYPEQQIIRDNEFLRAVASLSREFSMGVVFLGSILQHAFYQLRNEGVQVFCLEPFTPRKEVFEYNKLVRDKIPEKIERDGEIPNLITCLDEDYIEKLEEKILEEANEVAGASSIQDRTEEIADLFEVIEAICKKEDISLREILRVKRNKLARNGGFSEGIVLLSSESRPTIEVEKPFQKSVITKKKGTSKTPKIGKEKTTQLELLLKITKKNN